MKLSAVKKALAQLNDVNFILPDGRMVPAHFHVTEVGGVTKNFIDCGGALRKEVVVNFQLWEANDFYHRLKPQKLIDIIALSERVLGLQDEEVEVEYQGETIGKYGLEFDGINFLLTIKQTNCLALDKCGIPVEKQKLSLASLTPQGTTCSPGGGCC